MDIVRAVQPRPAPELQPESRRLLAPDAILRLCRALTREYGNPRLGNKSNPLDKLVYVASHRDPAMMIAKLAGYSASGVLTCSYGFGCANCRRKYASVALSMK